MDRHTFTEGLVLLGWNEVTDSSSFASAEGTKSVPGKNTGFASRVRLSQGGVEKGNNTDN